MQMQINAGIWIQVKGDHFKSTVHIQAFSHIKQIALFWRLAQICSVASWQIDLISEQIYNVQTGTTVSFLK